MKTIILILGICLATVASLPRDLERIVGGSETSINSYPFAATLHYTWNGVHFRHHCGATVINNRAVMTAAHCWNVNAVANSYRVRVGSSNLNSGGRLHNAARLIRHAQFNSRNYDNDIAIVQVFDAFPLGSATLQAAPLSSANFYIPDQSNVIAFGWGLTSQPGQLSEQLRHVTIRTMNQATCNNYYSGSITDNMICAAWTGRNICYGDTGSGLVFNNVVVGISSYFHWSGCHANYPAVFTRVSRYITWIQNNA